LSHVDAPKAGGRLNDPSVDYDVMRELTNEVRGYYLRRASDAAVHAERDEWIARSSSVMHASRAVDPASASAVQSRTIALQVLLESLRGDTTA